MRSYNELGIDGSLDWSCIRKLMVIGLLAGCMVMASDTPLGWGTRDSSEAGLEHFLSCYLTLTDGCIFWSALLGLIGNSDGGPVHVRHLSADRVKIPALCLSLPDWLLRLPDIRCCGVHMPCLACVFVYRHMGTSQDARGRRTDEFIRRIVYE